MGKILLIVNHNTNSSLSIVLQSQMIIALSQAIFVLSALLMGLLSSTDLQVIRVADQYQNIP